MWLIWHSITHGCGICTWFLIIKSDRCQELCHCLTHMPLRSLGRKGVNTSLRCAQGFQACAICDPTDCSPQSPLSLGFSRQEWVAMPFSRVGCHALLQGIFLIQGSTGLTGSTCFAGRFFTTEPRYTFHYEHCLLQMGKPCKSKTSQQLVQSHPGGEWRSHFLNTALPVREVGALIKHILGWDTDIISWSTTFIHKGVGKC